MAAIDLPHLSSGKVRDIYDAGDGRLLLVASDRISAFDVIMDEPIPDKGRVLTAMSAFWFELFADIVPGHLLSTDLADLPAAAQLPELAGRLDQAIPPRGLHHRVHRPAVRQQLLPS